MLRVLMRRMLVLRIVGAVDVDEAAVGNLNGVNGAAGNVGGPSQSGHILDPQSSKQPSTIALRRVCVKKIVGTVTRRRLWL